MNKLKLATLVTVSLSFISFLFLFLGSHSWNYIVVGGIFAFLSIATALYYTFLKAEKNKKNSFLIIIAIGIFFIVLGLIK